MPLAPSHGWQHPPGRAYLTGAFPEGEYDDVTPCVGKGEGSPCDAWDFTEQNPQGGISPGACRTWGCCPAQGDQDCPEDEERPCFVCLGTTHWDAADEATSKAWARKAGGQTFAGGTGWVVVALLTAGAAFALFPAKWAK